MNSEVQCPTHIFIVNIPDPTIIQQVFTNYMWIYAWVHKGTHPAKNAKHIFPSAVLGMMEFSRGRKEEEYDNQNRSDKGKYHLLYTHFTDGDWAQRQAIFLSSHK